MNNEKNLSSEIKSVKIFSEPESNIQSSSFQKTLLQNLKIIKLKIENHRFTTRTTLKVQPVKIFTFLSIVPFLIGFFQFIQQKYNFLRIPLILEKNIPIFQVPTEKLQWETIEYLEKQNQIAPVFKLGELYWSDTNLISHINFKNQKQKNFELWTSTNLIGTIIQKDFESPNRIISSKWYFIKLDPNSKNNILNFYSNLDELPTKLESLFLLNKKINFENEQVIIENDEGLNKKLPSNFLISSDKVFEKKTTSNKKLINNFITKKISNKIIFPEVFDSSFFLLNTKNLTELDNKVRTNNKKFFLKQKEISSLFEIQKSFFERLHLLKDEFEKIFILTGTIPNFKVTSYTFSPIILQVLENEESKFLNEFLEDIQSINLSDEFFSSRLMSGYKYPDMTSLDIKWFISKNFFSNKVSKNFEIQLPPSFSLIRKYPFSGFNKPEFLIQAQHIQLKNIEDNNPLYKGPAFSINREQGFDWIINSKTNNSKQFSKTANFNFRNWLEIYLSTLNPFSNQFLNFFGLFDGPEVTFENVKKESLLLKLTNSELQTTYWFTRLPFFQTGILSNTENSLIPFERSFQIPYILKKDWDFYFKQNNQSLLTDNSEKEFIEISLPLVETRLPIEKNPLFLFGLHPSIDYSSFSMMPYQNKSSIQGDFLPEINSYLRKETFDQQYASGIYQRVLSGFYPNIANNLFNGANNSFYDIWEPLTFQSWLLISQVGFAFLVFSILKALADNYGRELLVYLLDLVALLGFLDEDLKQEIEILMGQREKGFRIISKTRKTFKDIAGIEKLLPEIIEIVWFLRNSAREFSLSKTLPRGVLLTGPPGTGKTLLVQALAGESDVPVLALSGSSLLEPGESGALKLEILFQEARKLAPCIVFIDEIDTLAEKRQQVLQNPMGADELLESLHSSQNIATQQTDISSLINSNTSLKDDTSETETILEHQDLQREKLRILMQFLVELDGIQGRDGVVVVGATNRPEMLDPAILRPGRFDRIVELGLPGPEKRKDILKLYSQNLGITKNISWNYLANRTAGFSAADLASIMNQSSLKAISLDISHSIETIEHGIDRITTFETQKPKNSLKTQLSLLRFAYYQAGKIILSILLYHHPNTLVTHLWPRRTNVRALQISSNVQKYFFKYARRIELEHRLIGCYAGKAAEIIFLQSGDSKDSEINLSDLGVEDIQFGQNLIQFMTQTWSLYTKQNITQKFTNITDTRNQHEYQDSLGKITFFEKILTGIQTEPFQQNFDNLNDQNSSNSTTIEIPIDQQPQSYFSVPWWQYQIANEFEITTRLFSDWYRLYLPDPQETERNLEWSPPDEFYHGNTLLNPLTEAVNWNDIESIRVQYQIHSLVLQSFNEAFSILDKYRELLDKLAYELMEREILREPEIENIFENFIKTNSDKNEFPLLLNKITEGSSSDFFQEKIETFANENIEKKILADSWGTNSRRPKQRWINLPEINQ